MLDIRASIWSSCVKTTDVPTVVPLFQSFLNFISLTVTKKADQIWSYKLFWVGNNVFQPSFHSILLNALIGSARFILLNPCTDLSVCLSGPTAVVHPQYYSVQTPWGIYPAAGLLQQSGNNQQVPQQQQQQQILRGSTGRLTPSQDGLGTPTGSLQSQPATIQAGECLGWFWVLMIGQSYLKQLCSLMYYNTLN